VDQDGFGHAFSLWRRCGDHRNLHDGSAMPIGSFIVERVWFPPRC
jgi:hypothetical protein